MPQLIRNETYYTTEDVSKIIGRHPNTVLTLIREERIDADSVNGAYIVSKESICAYLDEIKLPHSTIDLRLGKVSPKSGKKLQPSTN